MNRVDLTGRLTRDPEVKYVGQNGDLCMATYTLAVDREFARDDEQDADFIRCKAFGKRGEFAEKYFCKGMRIGVCGRIQTGSYDDQETGKKVYTTDVMVDQQEFLESKAANEQHRSENGSASGSNQTQADEDGFMNIPDGIDEELPFV
jgi:single-strand DNA-binding protein